MSFKIKNAVIKRLLMLPPSLRDDIITLDPIKRLGTAPEIIRAFGGKPAYDDAIHALTDELSKAA